MTTHVVRLKLFRLKAEGIRKARLTHVGGKRAGFRTKHDAFVKSQNHVTPAKAGVHNYLKALDSCFRRNDKQGQIGLFTRPSNMASKWAVFPFFLTVFSLQPTHLGSYKAE